MVLVTINCRSAVFDGIWARLLRWKARESGILNKETFKKE
jgi:hypothetical protein